MIDKLRHVFNLARDSTIKITIARTIRAVSDQYGFASIANLPTDDIFTVYDSQHDIDVIGIIHRGVFCGWSDSMPENFIIADYLGPFRLENVRKASNDDFLFAVSHLDFIAEGGLDRSINWFLGDVSVDMQPDETEIIFHNLVGTDQIHTIYIHTHRIKQKYRDDPSYGDLITLDAVDYIQQFWSQMPMINLTFEEYLTAARALDDILV